MLPVLAPKRRGKRTPAKPVRATAMWRASLILQKSREATAKREVDIDETSQTSVLRPAADTKTEQVTTTGWQREYSSNWLHVSSLNISVV